MKEDIFKTLCSKLQIENVEKVEIDTILKTCNVKFKGAPDTISIHVTNTRGSVIVPTKGTLAHTCLHRKIGLTEKQTSLLRELVDKLQKEFLDSEKNREERAAEAALCEILDYDRKDLRGMLSNVG